MGPDQRRLWPYHQMTSRSRGPGVARTWTVPWLPAVTLAVALVLLVHTDVRVCAATVSTPRRQLVYRMECPIDCACTLDDDISTVSTPYPTAAANLGEWRAVSSVNCSARGLHWSVLPATSTTNTTTAHGDDEGRNASTAVVWLQPRLAFLDLSHNRLTSVATNISEPDWVPLGATLQVSVSHLDLSYNQLEVLPTQSFLVYAHLQSLCLAHNGIYGLSAGTFKGVEGLERLDLSHNSISDMESSVLGSLVHLESLDLSHNRLQVVDKLPVLPSLKYLYLQHNNIQHTIGSSHPLLSPLPSLSSLDVSHNPLGGTQANMFAGMSQLSQLDLSSCYIDDLDRHFLAGLPHLEQLTLDNNTLTSISSPVFQNTSLTHLSVTSMPGLVNISHDAFLGLSHVSHLNLSHNHAFAFLQPHLLASLGQLAVLDVSDCAISHLSNITFHYSRHLRQVTVAGNPLACTCVNAWLAGDSPFLQDVANLSCVNTSTGLAQPIIPASFPCPEISVHNQSSPVASVPLGSQLMLPCRHTSEEPVMVSWTTPSGQTFHQHHFHPQASTHLLGPHDVKPGAPYHSGHNWRSSSTYHPELEADKDRILMLSDGSLYINYMLRTDPGTYTCHITNGQFNHTSKIVILLDYKISGEVKIYGIIVGLLCALAFFTLNVIYIIISWIARRLVNKRRREIIRQMLENMNAYKSAQIGRIHENYTHQLGKVRNQYHTQRDRLHRNYTQQVARVKRGCSNQVERVRDNYTSRLAQLRDYSSNQIVQIRERANTQIGRIRDYGTSQLERLRETYKLQHLHVMKLLDTMNLDNCRHIVETECMRAESMMFDIDLLGDDYRTESPVSGTDSEYATPDTSPAPSLEDKASTVLSSDLAQHQPMDKEDHPRKKFLHPAQHSPHNILLEMESGLAVDVTDQWEDTDLQGQVEDVYVSGKGTSQDDTFLQMQSEPEIQNDDGGVSGEKEGFPLPVLSLEDEPTQPSDQHNDPEQGWGSLYMTPQASPTKTLVNPASKSLRANLEEKDSETDL